LASAARCGGWTAGDFQRDQGAVGEGSSGQGDQASSEDVGGWQNEHCEDAESAVGEDPSGEGQEDSRAAQ